MVCVCVSAVQPSYVFCMCVCICVYLRGGLIFSSVVLSLLLQQETGTEIVRSQGTIGGKVTIAQASSSLIMSNRSHWICSPPLMCFKLPKTTVEQTKPRHKSIWSAHVRTRWWEAGPVFFSTPHLLPVLSILTFLSFFLTCSGSTPLSVSSADYYRSVFLCVQTLPVSYSAGADEMSAVSSCGRREKRPKQTCAQRFGQCCARVPH